MGIGMFRRSYDEQPAVADAPTFPPSVGEVGAEAPVSSSALASATKSELLDFLAEVQGSPVTDEQSRLKKSELLDLIANIGN